MTTLASVDLPEPFGPISAWNSPERTWRSTPLRICLSPAATWRFSIFRSAMKFQWSGGGGELDELREGRALERLDDADLHAGPEELGRAVLAVAEVRAGDAAVAVVEEAVHRRDRALEREDDVVHRDLLGGAREQVAAVRAARGLDEAGLLQQRGDALEVGQRKVLRVGHRLERDGLVGALQAQLDEQPDAVLRLRREDHRGRKPTNAVGVLSWTACAGRISATSPSSPTSTTGRPRWSTRCCGSPVRSAPTRTSPSGSWTPWTSSARRASRSWPRTPPSATAA